MDVVTRKEWGARPPKRRDLLSPNAIRELVAHYSASAADEQALHVRCPGRVLGIQRFHMSPDPRDPTKPWSDIAYNWIVCRHGAIFRGRGWPVRSAATGPANGFTVAVCFLGNDAEGRQDVTLAAQAAILTVLNFVERHTSNAVVLAGHRDHMRTECPGDELYSWLTRVNRERQE